MYNIQPICSDTELVKSLPLAASANDAVRLVVYSIPVSAKAGDVLHITAAAEVTNPNIWAVGVGRYLTLGVTPADTSGKLIMPARIGYVYNNGQHTAIDLATHHVFDADFIGFVNLVAYAYLPLGGLDITVHGYQENGQAYGELKGLLFTSGEGFQPLTPITLQVNYPQPKKSFWQRIFGA